MKLHDLTQRACRAKNLINSEIKFLERLENQENDIYPQVTKRMIKQSKRDTVRLMRYLENNAQDIKKELDWFTGDLSNQKSKINLKFAKDEQ